MEFHRNLIETKIIPRFVKSKQSLLPHYKLKSHEIKQLGGDTFMLTICHQVHIILTNSDSDREYWLFVKISPECDTAQFHFLFSNEIMAYTKIIPNFDATGKYVKLCDHEVQRTVSYLVLDDFTKNGWRLASDMVNLSLDHICVALKELAAFHGKFYVLKIQNKQKFMEIVDELHESRYANDMPESYSAGARAGCKRAVKSVRNSHLKDIIPESFLQKLETLIEDPHSYGRRMVRPKEPLSTLCHGDYLRNNIAFRYKLDADGTDVASEAMMFDLQTIRHSSPMIDFCVFICNSTGIDVRGSNFDKIFDVYFNTLIETVKEDIADVPAYFNRTTFLQEYVKYLPMGLAIASSFLPILMHSKELIIDLNNPMGPEEAAKQITTLGGEKIDRELRSIINQLYELSVQLNVDVFAI